MKKQAKVLFALVCVLALAGTAAASSIITTRTLEAQYMGIKLTVDGRAVTPKTEGGETIEPFMVDGTVYLPVRAVGEALGRGVEWDAETHTVALISPFLQDARQLTQAVERAHPAFALGDVPEGYEAAKAAFLQTAGEPDVTLYDFSWSALAYTAAMKDGHTSVWVFGNDPQPALDIGWVADGEHLYLTDGKGSVTSQEVTAIGGMSTAQVFAAIDTYFAAENKAAQDRNHTQWAANPNLLAKAGAVMSDNAVALGLLDGKTASERTVQFVQPMGGGAREPVVSHKMLDDVFYVDLNECVVNEQVEKAAAALKEAVDGGTQKVILDVRGNGGGNSDACYAFLRAMGMEIPQYGVYVRFSELALDTHQPYERGYTKTEGGDRYEPDTASAKPNSKIKLVVLTDEDTYSSATMLGVWTQDGKLGTVIGRPSANAPSSYGDILYYTMDGCGLTATISHKQWLRPDSAADPRMLHPDVETAVGEDALTVALDYLAK